MYVVPPPIPTPPSPTKQPTSAPIIVIPVETQNAYRRAERDESSLKIDEGNYILRDVVLLGTPAANTDDPTLYVTNPLDITIPALVSGTKLSITRLGRIQPTSTFRKETPVSSHVQPHVNNSIETDSQGTLNSDAVSSPTESSTYQSSLDSSLAAFGSDNPTLVTNGSDKAKEASKPKKPKSSLAKSSSSFLVKIQIADGIQKRLMNRDVEESFVVANIGRAFQWLDFSSEKQVDYLTRVVSKHAEVLCHDINEASKNNAHLDVVVGYNSSDLIWYEAISQRYSRINKHGLINDAPVTSVLWMPQSANLIIAAHADGSVIVYDKERDDVPFNFDEDEPPLSNLLYCLTVVKSVHSRAQKSNPVSYWNLGGQRINSMAFSPDGRYLAVVSQDGALRIIHMARERLTSVHKSYFGGLTTVCWSPDGKYILGGGEDDDISIWSFVEDKLVARCRGHSSWVRDVKFDPWLCEVEYYRFASVGEDCKLCFWDFCPVKPVKMSTAEHSASIKSTSLDANRSRSEIAVVEDNNPIVHPVILNKDVVNLKAVLIEQVGDRPLTWLGFEEDCIIISSFDGYIRTWDRPNSTTRID